MRWLNLIKDHDWKWLKRIPKFFKSITTAPIIIFLKTFFQRIKYRGRRQCPQDMDSPDATLINPEELAEELSRHLPDQQSSEEKNAEIQELKNTIERLQQDTANESKKAALQELSEDEITKAADLLKKSAQSREKQSEQPAKEAALDWIDIGNITFLINSTQSINCI